MSLDLALVNNSDWERIFTADQAVIYTDEFFTSYEPIPVMFATVDKHTLLVGVSSETALSHWYLGAKVFQYLYISPSPTPGLAVGVKTGTGFNAKLGSMTLIQFQNFNLVPYLLSIEIPYWIKDVHVEVWKYLGVEQFNPGSNGSNYDGGTF